MLAYAEHLAVLFEIYLMLALGLQIVLGWGGLFNLAHIGLFGVGAYTQAVLSTDFQVNGWIALLLAPVITTVVAYPIYAISLRLQSDFFAIGSLAFAYCISSIFTNWSSVTHGVLGIPGIPRPEFFGISLDENGSFLILTTVVTLSFSLISIALRYSAYGTFLLAQSEFEYAVDALGVSSARIRGISFVFSAVYAGIAGALFAVYMTYIDPTSFSLSEMVFVLSTLVLGGMYSIRGTIASTAFLILLPESLRFLSVPSSILGPARQGLYAVTLFLVVYLRRRSLFIPKREI